MKQTYWTITDDKNVKTSDILAEARKFFKVWVWREDTIDTELPAPKETVTVSFKKSIESDKEHKGKSYNDFSVEKDATYMTARQYLLLCIHVFKETGEHLDVIGWTRTSSLWSDGCLVDGCFLPVDREVGLGHGGRDFRGPGCGPRASISVESVPSTLEPVSLAPSIEDAIQVVKNAGYKVMQEL